LDLGYNCRVAGRMCNNQFDIAFLLLFYFSSNQQSLEGLGNDRKNITTLHTPTCDQVEYVILGSVLFCVCVCVVCVCVLRVCVCVLCMSVFW